MYQLDHFVWETFDLYSEVKKFTELTGVSPKYGGEHPNKGTHNSLLALGDTLFLEIIAPNPAQADKFGFPKQALKGFASRLMAFGYSYHDLSQLTRTIAKAGLTIGYNFEISRKTPEGQTLSWHTITLSGHSFGQFLPFFTQRLSQESPLEGLEQVCTLERFSVGHPEDKALAQLYDKLGLAIAVKKTAVPTFQLVINTPKGLLDLNTL